MTEGALQSLASSAWGDLPRSHSPVVARGHRAVSCRLSGATHAFRHSVIRIDVYGRTLARAPRSAVRTRTAARDVNQGFDANSLWRWRVRNQNPVVETAGGQKS